MSAELNIQKIKIMLELQAQNGNWNYNAYMLGVYNGLELALASLESRQARCKEAPLKWLDTKEKTSQKDIKHNL